MAIALRRSLAAFLLLGIFAGDLAQAASGKLTVEVNGLKRSAVLVENTRLKRVRRPLVIVLHGSNRGDGARIRRNLGLEEFFGEYGAVLVFPDAHEGRWAIEPKPGGIDDAAFFRAIIDKLEDQRMIDPKRVFLVGVSTGGMMAMQAICSDAGTYSGVATVMANMPKELAATCKPARPVAALMINGTADPRVPWLGGATTSADQVSAVASTDETVGIFAKAASCGEAAKEISFPNRNPKSGSRAYLDRFEGCSVPVERVRIEGGGHTIPGQNRWSGADAGAAVGAHNVDVDAAKLIYDFFRRLNGA